MRDVKTSVALYSAGSEVERTKLVQQMVMRLNRAVTEMLASAREPLAKDPEMVASMLQAAMSGVVRKLLESPAPEKEFQVLHQEAIFLVCTYLGACAARPR